MKHNIKFNTLAGNSEWLGIIGFLQDIIHIATKLRNRFLNSLAILLIGNKIASVSHLKILLNLVSKDIHGLVYSDICPDDRQNFDSLKKIMQMRVRESLSQSVLHCEGTIEYIRMCEEITSSLYEENLSPLERLTRIWRSTYFMRAWRLWITQNVDNGLSLDENFITANCYACIEINAQNLVILIRKFRDENLSEFFLPTIFNSQPCEETFRKMRSMGTVNYTKINFTMLELMHLVGRIELMNDIMNFKLGDVDVCFPRNPSKRFIKNNFDLPSDIEIENCMLTALSAAITDAKKFGINVTSENIKHCNLKDIKINLNSESAVKNDEIIDCGIASQEIENLHAKMDTPLDENSSFVNVNDGNEPKIVRKSTLMWSLSKSKTKLSADRTVRVRGTKRKRSQRRLEFVDVCMQGHSISKVDVIKIGDWCIFENVFKGSKAKFILGNILSFKYANGKNVKEKQYIWDSASIEHEENIREIEAMAYWYQMDINGELFPFDHISCTFIRNKHYIATLLYNVIDKEKLCIAQEYLMSIQNELKHL